MEEMLQRRGNMQNVPFSSHVAQVAFSPIILSSALLILFPFPAEFNPVSIFCTLTQAQKRACEHTHSHTARGKPDFSKATLPDFKVSRSVPGDRCSQASLRGTRTGRPWASVRFLWGTFRARVDCVLEPDRREGNPCSLAPGTCAPPTLRPSRLPRLQPPCAPAVIYFSLA